jgi:acyl carrier protein
MDANRKPLNMIRDTFESLQRTGIISKAVQFSESTTILGSESELDSLGFVTFISDLEERISVEAGDEVYLVLDDINGFNMNNPSLTARVLAEYVAELMNKAP